MKQLYILYLMAVNTKLTTLHKFCIDKCWLQTACQYILPIHKWRKNKGKIMFWKQDDLLGGKKLLKQSKSYICLGIVQLLFIKRRLFCLKTKNTCLLVMGNPYKFLLFCSTHTTPYIRPIVLFMLHHFQVYSIHPNT